DNMTDIEMALIDIGELTTRDIAKNEKPNGLEQNRQVAKRGGSVAKKTKDFYEEVTGFNAITNANSLKYQYIDNLDKLE
ncbi:MAG: phage antirepressor protein, partial [Bacilli bacterium]|nr:phage antirepressor protein [Bacilli bacterium]